MLPFSLRIYRTKDRLSPLLATDNAEELVRHLRAHVVGQLRNEELIAAIEYAVNLWTKNPGFIFHIPLTPYCGLRISSNLLED